MNENILNYIQQYKSVYTKEAIYQELLKAGHSTADIEAAWVKLNSISDAPAPPAQNESEEKSKAVSQPPARPPAVQATPTQPAEGNKSWVGGVYLLGLIAIPWLASSLGHLEYIIPMLVLALGGGVATIIVFRKRDPALSRALTKTLQFAFVVFVVIPFVIFAIVIGICVVSGTKMG